MSDLDCQRHLFELPRAVSYLNTAAWSPVPLAVRAAGEAGMLVKRQPWSYVRNDNAFSERTRAAAAALIGAEPGDVAITGSVAQAMAIAAHNLRPAPGTRLLRIADEFPSHVLTWDRLAEASGLTVETVARPAGDDWASALLAAIDRPGAPPVSIATLSPLHWADGTRIDLAPVADAVHSVGAALVIDATQAIGAVPFDLARLRPDFLAFPTYKWVLGPYGLAFLYAAPHRQEGAALEHHSGNRSAEGARRYDKGEREEPVGLQMAAAGLQLVASWGAERVAARLRAVTERRAEGRAALGATLPQPGHRSPHIIGARLPGGVPAALVAGLAEDGVFVSERLGFLRISPHVWVDDADVDRCLDALRRRIEH